MPGCGNRDCGYALDVPEEPKNQRIFFQCPRCLAVYSVYHTNRNGVRWTEVTTHVIPCGHPPDKRQLMFTLDPTDFCACNLTSTSWMICPRHSESKMRELNGG